MPDPGAEFNAKRAWEYGSPRQGADVLPVVYGDLTDGTGGQWTLPCIDTQNYVYALAAHPVVSHTPTIYDKNQNVISASNYAFSIDNDYQGNGAIATVDFTSDMAAYEPISAQGKGQADQAGALIENPALAAEDFLIEWAGWQSTDVDATRLAVAKEGATALAFKAARVIDTVKSVGAVLSEIMGSFLGSWWLGGEGECRIVLSGDTFLESEVAGRFYGPRLTAVKVTGRLTGIVNQVEIKYRPRNRDGQYQAGLSGSDTADTSSQSVYGQRSHTLETPWIRDDDTARAIALRLVARHGSEQRIIEFQDGHTTNMFLEKGDLGLLSLTWLFDSQGSPLVNQIVRVLEIAPDFSKQSTRFKVLDTRMYKTVAYLADGTYLAGGQIMAGGERDRNQY